MTLHNRTVRQDVRELGRLLGDVLREQTSRRHFEIVEDLRTSAIDYRDGELESRQDLRQTLDALTPEEESIVARAFTTYFELINLAESREHVRAIREGSNTGELSSTPEETAMTLADADLEGDDVERLLADVRVEPTFTDHPTEARRKTVKTKLESISEHLEALDEHRLTKKERRHHSRDIDAEVTSFWQTPQVRTRQPQAGDEARNVQWYLENTLYDTIGEVYDEFETAFDEVFEDVSVPQLVGFRSWAGGDRAGNPHITPDVTEKTLERQRRAVLERYREDLFELLGVLSQDGSRIDVGEAFEKSLSADRDRLPGVAEEARERYPGEPYRQKLLLMRERLDRVGDVRPGGYDDVADFEADLAVIADSLRANGADEVVAAHVEPLRRRVETFGFALASLDLRDRTDAHTTAVTALLDRVGIDYADLAEADRQEVLTDAIRQDEPIVDLTDRTGLEESTARVCELFERLADWHRRFSPEAVDRYAVAGVEAPSEVLEVLFLADQADVVDLPGHAGINIVPIFSTVDGLTTAADCVETLLENPAYEQAVTASDQFQEVMLSYADTNQESGFLSSAWARRRTKLALAAVVEDRPVDLRMLHGRGGPISRGGSPMNDALRAEPPATIAGPVGFLEEGEAIAEKYGNRRIAERNIEQMIDAQMRARCEATTGEIEAIPDSWLAAMETMSGAAHDAYRELVGAEAFGQFFETTTPIAAIEELDLGSGADQARGERAIEEIDATAWMFAWTQARFLLPGWYGIATGIDAYLEAGGSIETLSKMYDRWPFFSVMVDYATLALGRADIEIAEEYARNAPPEVREAFVSQIRTEYERAVTLLTDITDREHPIDRDYLRESLHRRNPYVEPLHLLQQHLLSQTHRTETEERTLRLTLKGISAGLKNTG